MVARYSNGSTGDGNVKNALRATHHAVSEHHLYGYLYRFNFNRRFSLDTLVNRLA
jgi:hypothetical protein